MDSYNDMLIQTLIDAEPYLGKYRDDTITALIRTAKKYIKSCYNARINLMLYYEEYYFINKTVASAYQEDAQELVKNITKWYEKIIELQK
ncbi:MAG: hypothetical protein ACYCPT_03895 [Acidimicrobiales bacterium]